VLPILAAVPALAALLFSVSIILVVVLGGTARWLDNDFNLAEASLIGDVGRVFRLLESGEPVAAPYSLRTDGRFPKSARIYKELTSLEAAIIGDMPAVLALLIEHGAAGTPPDLNAVWCAARKRDAQRIDKWLTESRANAPSCP
jgi:hypothetical protein